MALLGFKYRLSGAAAWITLPADVVVKRRTVKGPRVKTNYANIPNVNGVLDYSEAIGLHYDTKTVEVSLLGAANSTYDFDGLRRAILGRKLDFQFSDDTKAFNEAYYHTGRVVEIEDDYRQDFRTVKLIMDCDPLRKPVSGAYIGTVNVYSLSAVNLLTGNETILYADQGAGGWHTIQDPNAKSYADSGGSEITITVTKDSDTVNADAVAMLPEVFIKTPVSLVANKTYTFQCDSPNGTARLELEYKSTDGEQIHKKREFDKNGQVAITASDLTVTSGGKVHTLSAAYIVLTAKTMASTSFKNMWFAESVEAGSLQNGDAPVTPMFSTEIETGKAWIFVNGVKTEWRAGEKQPLPTFVLREGSNDIYIVTSEGATFGSSAHTNVSYERLIL